MTFPSCQYYYEQSEGILYKTYIGPVNYAYFESTWKEAFTSGIAHEGIKRYIVDYTAARYDIKISEYIKIAEFYKEHIKFFQGARIAVIVASPHDIVIPILVETKDDGYASKVFTTVAAAKKWALR